MKIRLIEGFYVAGVPHHPGDVVEVGDKFGEESIETGRAVLAIEDPPKAQVVEEITNQAPSLEHRDPSTQPKRRGRRKRNA